jgi:hypothetical protein
MSYRHFPRGLYFARQWSQGKGVWHYAIVAIHQGSEPVVIHLCREGLRVDWLRDTGTWHTERITDEAGAVARLQRIPMDQRYDWLVNNCEQFARHVAEGRHESTQVRSAVVLLGAVALALCS